MGIDNRQLWQIINSRVQSVDFSGLASRAKRWSKEKYGDDEDDEIFPVNAFIGQAGLRKSKTQKKLMRAKLRDERLPASGTVIHKKYKGRNYSITILENGFEYEGVLYKSLSAIANEITDSHWNGYIFFGLKVSPKESK